MNKGSSEFQATQDFHQKFGDEPVIVLAKEDLRKLVLTKDLEPLFELEECFAGGTQLARRFPTRQGAAPAGLRPDRPAAPEPLVFGPATFLFLSVAGIQQALQGQIGASATGAGRRDQAPGPPRSAGSPAVQEQAANAASHRFSGSSSPACKQVANQYGLHLDPAPRRSELRHRVVFDESKAAGTPKERFGYLFPTGTPPRSSCASAPI